MWGSRWDPWAWVEQQPDVQVVKMELSGRLQGCADPVERIIWLDERLPPVQERCTLAYEIAQLQRGPLPDDPCLAAAHRRDCEDWAARMLIPLEGLLDGFTVAAHLPQIAEWLGVDLPTLRARLRGLTDDEQDAVMEAIRRWQAAAA